MDGWPSSPWPAELGSAPGPSYRPAWVQEGRKLGRYRLGPVLGRGGMGEVYEAWDTVLGRTVAVKTLNAPHPDAILRFMKEAQLQARVSHPNVCRIFDVDVADGVPVIAMQLVKGPSLFQAAPELSLEEAVEILASVSLAMHAAHRLNLVHRDLKPSNILLEKAPGGGWVPYVADFGLAKDLEDKGLTQTRGVLGTPSYMAPEQRRGEGARVGPAADLYALGATLCAVLDLERPEGATSLQAGAARRATRDPGLRRRWGDLPRKLRNILIRCLEERPQDRYPTAGALAEDFRRFLDGEPLLAEHRAWLRRSRRLLRGHPALAASLAITLVLGGGFGAWSAHLGAAARRRTALALRFAMDARDLENSIGVERLHPPHDLRPLIVRMNAGLERIQKDIEHLGPDAKGPGNLALGRGYLTMRHLEPALAALERAWNAGYRTPDVAYALCKTHCDLYLRVVSQEQLGDLPPSPEASRMHLQAARACYALCAGATWEPPELCGTRILIYERRGEEALAMARGLFERNRWLYEAKVEEAYALEAMGYDRQRSGDAKAALACYQQAEACARFAQNLGRSDITCYLAGMDWRFHWLENPALPPAKALAVWQEAEDLVDVVLAIRPESPRALSAKVHAVLGRARALRKLGRDPGPDLARAERFLRAVRPQEGFGWLIPVKAELIRRTRRDLLGDKVL